MTRAEQAQLAAVNAEVNAIPFNEVLGPGEPPDWWTDQPMAGNSWVCRDYVQLKADKLKALGWPASALTTVLCWVEDPPGGYHAVLAVQLPNGDGGDPETTILDSRVDAPYPMSAPPLAYRWDRRQIAGTTDFEALA